MRDHELPVARLHPRNGEDRAAIRRSRAKEGVRKAGRVALGVGKVGAMLVACCLGLAAIGSMRTRPQPPRYELKTFKPFDTSKLDQLSRELQGARYYQPRRQSYVPLAPTLQHESRATSSR